MNTVHILPCTGFLPNDTFTCARNICRRKGDSRRRWYAARYKRVGHFWTNYLTPWRKNPKVHHRTRAFLKGNILFKRQFSSR
jgi:hypothetical protein